jgi:hypothetical protein
MTVPEPVQPVLEFLFILLVPLAVVAAVLVGLFAVGALFDFLEHPDEVRGRLDGLFRRPPRPARPPREDHYYRPHWQR